MSTENQTQQENELTDSQPTQKENHNIGQQIEDLSNKVIEQKQLVDQLEDKINKMTDELYEINKNTNVSIYSPQIFVILCLIFLIAQAYKNSV